MNTTAAMDLICAVFIGILYARTVSDRSVSKSNRLLNLCLVFMLAALLVDAAAYSFIGPSYSLPVRFFINFLSFIASCVNVIAFTFYAQALFEERADDVKTWPFRALKTLEFIWALATAYEYFAGHLLTYDAGGFENFDYGIPAYIVFLSLVIQFCLLFITIVNRRKIGKDMALMLCLFFTAPILTSVLYSFVHIDLTYSFGAIMLGLVTEFIQKKQTQKLKQEQTVIRELANQQRYLKAFGDMVNAALWTVKLNDADEIVSVYWSDDARRMLGFGEKEGDRPDTVEAWADIIHPEDKPRVLAHIRNSIKNRDTADFVFDIEFRMRRKSGEYIWYHTVGRMEDEKDGTRSLFGIVFDIQAERQLKEQQALSDGLAREYHTVWLMDGFGSHDLHLYRSTGKTTVQSAVRLGLDHPCYDTSVVQYIRDNILEEDQERVIEATRFGTIERETPEVGTYVVSYRRYTADRRDYTWHQMCFARAAGADGTVNYILAYRDADKILREQTAQQEQIFKSTRIITALSADFSCVDFVEYHENKINDVAMQIRVSKRLIRAIPEWESETSFTKRLDLLIERIVYEPDRKRVYEETRRERVLQILNASEAVLINFRICPENEILYYQMKISAVKNKDTVVGFVVGIHSIDREMKKELEDQRQIREALARAEEESIRRKMIYKISDSSPWSYEISTDDEVVSVDYSDRLLETVNARPSGEAMGWLQIVHPEDKDRVLTGFMAPIRDHSGNTVYDESYRIMDREGNYRRVRSVGRVIRRADGTGEYIGMAMDYTAQFREQEKQKKQVEDALAVATLANQHNNMLHEAIKSGPWSFTVEPDNKTVQGYFSDELRKLVHHDLKADPYDWTKLVHPDDREHAGKTFWTALFDPECKTPYDDIYRLMGDDGVYRWFHSAGRKIRLADGRSEMFGLFMDITERTEKERAQQKQLAEALSMADAANKAKTDFLFNMSHDIRTPMNAIIGFTNIAKKDIDRPEKVKECLEKVQLSSDILLNLINDVLDMSRIESGKVELHEEKYEIIEAFDSFEPAMASLAASKDIDLQFSIGKVRDRYIFADGPRFDRVLINLISNAIKYTLPGGFVKVTAEQIGDTEPGYGNYRFTVSDSGIGMSEEFQKHMFEDFTREENSTTSGIQGTGLGLSLVKKLVDLMGGTVSCVSRQGIGTTFSAVFPFRLQTQADMAEEQTAVQEHGEIDLSGRKVLLVEDNEFNREIAAEILAEEGLLVETAADGQKAVNRVRERGIAYYDFILMDIQMPIMNGFEATRIIREMYPDDHIPIIALSANAFKEDRTASINAGMDDHVAKPIDAANLRATLARHL